MNQSLSDLEKEIEESRARLDETIDRIQDRLSPVNLVDEMLGSARSTSSLNGLYDDALVAVRRNPLPVLLIAAGVGMLMSKLGRRQSREMRRSVRGPIEPAPRAGAERAYDPDRPGGRPGKTLQDDVTA